jgi:putative component of membrane protein insertase Oxa1/YidC/SpoIIIJ protein YidD
MKYLVLIVIRLYWKLVPASKRRKCVFKESCSNAVYKETNNNGFIKGLETLLFRFRNCNNRFELTVDFQTERTKVILKDGTLIDFEEMRDSVL